MGNENPVSFVFRRCPNTEGEPFEKRGATAHLYNEQLPTCTMSNCCRSRKTILVSTALHYPGSESGAEEMGRMKMSINKI
jgi:hypothetical protein